MRRSEPGADNPGVIPVPRLPSTCARRRAARQALLVGALAALTALPHASAREEHDHERARAAVRAGEVLPLPTLLERLQRTHPGQVLELELERDDGRWVYEVKLLRDGGQLLKLRVDAATGQVLDARRRKPDRTRPEGDASR